MVRKKEFWLNLEEMHFARQKQNYQFYLFDKSWYFSDKHVYRFPFFHATFFLTDNCLLEVTSTKHKYQKWKLYLVSIYMYLYNVLSRMVEVLYSKLTEQEYMYNEYVDINLFSCIISSDDAFRFLESTTPYYV